MREDFNCSVCGKNFDLDFEGKEKSVECPKCKTRWRIESKAGRYRMSVWV